MNSLRSVNSRIINTNPNPKYSILSFNNLMRGAVKMLFRCHCKLRVLCIRVRPIIRNNSSERPIISTKKQKPN